MQCKTNSRTKFSVLIGDRSDDGHCKKETFFYSTATSVESVAEAHFKIKEKFGIDIEGICNQYDDYKLSVKDTNTLYNLGCEDVFEDQVTYIDAEFFADIWMFLLNKVDENLDITKERDDIKRLNDYGIGVVGYGLFQ